MKRMKCLLLVVLVALVVSQGDPRRPKPQKTQFIADLLFNDLDSHVKGKEQLGHGKIYMDAFNQRMRMDFNFTSGENEKFTLLVLDFLNEQAFLLVQKGNGFDCERGVPDESENPFIHNHFNNARYRGYQLINNRVSGTFDQAEFVWPVIGKGEYNYDIFEGHPTRILGKIDDLRVRFDYKNQTEHAMNDELFLLPPHIPCGSTSGSNKNKISNRMTKIFNKVK